MLVLAYHSFWYQTDIPVNEQSKSLFKGPYDDYEVRWYMSVGTQIIITTLLMIITPHILLIFMDLPSCLMKCRDRHWSCSRKKTL